MCLEALTEQISVFKEIPRKNEFTGKSLETEMARITKPRGPELVSNPKHSFTA
jgi:hypothetical protein